MFILKITCYNPTEQDERKIISKTDKKGPNNVSYTVYHKTSPTPYPLYQIASSNYWPNHTAQHMWAG